MPGLPEVDVLFSHFQVQAGSLAAARVRFQSLVTELIGVRHPNADEVAGPGGTDWGIDTYVGKLSDDVFVWQSKFFPAWNSKDPQQQVRESFKQLLSKAAENGLTVRSWTLCVPCILDPAQQLWFDRWAERMKRETGVEINMWNGVHLRRLLLQPDARHVLQEYFPSGLSELPTEGLATATDLSLYNEALFVKQLEVAGYIQNDSARGSFFAAEVVARDVVGRADPEAIMGLAELDADVHAAWEVRFNHHSPSADSAGRMTDLISEVLADVAALPNPHGLNVRPAHRRGFMHRVVDDRRAGWVTHWRDVAAASSQVKGAPLTPADAS